MINKILTAIRSIRDRAANALVGIQTKLHVRSIRQAIEAADKDHSETGRKNIVVYNQTTAEYEPVQKRVLKKAAEVGKNRSNKAHTAGRKRMMKKKDGENTRAFTPERVKKIEKRSLYVTN